MRPLLAPGSSRAHALLTRPRAPTALRSAYAPAAVSRRCVVAASSRLVLTPTGSGSCDHIGAKVPRPGPIPLKDGVYEVGRSSPADILLPIPTVSTRHALLRVENDTVYVTDLNSTNGTMVNGQELSPMDNVAVEVGTEVIFGDIYLARFQLDLASDPGAPDGAGAGAGAAGSGSTGTVADSGTVVMGPEDSGDGPGPEPAAAAAFGGQQQDGGRESSRRPIKRPVVRRDYTPY